ncbi:NTP transferase domain-containing protein [Paenibacillus sp. ATY16]|uniref:nucleotidyltransferase family protein n=1 Tax=Paenibacillus sp. ATY16 TaxID=1759312 RepID=UPI00200D6B95|nr:NTP transferase domain-containing protein [Paenibacillus sp. ATY16]MCK9861408.1 NTP transferase domain-containing protein [Paenibacillus sp. ATY16]
MGKPKLPLELSPGVALGSLALRALLASGIGRIHLVVRPDDPLTWLQDLRESSLYAPQLNIVVCEEASLGMSYSIRAGVDAALSSLPVPDAVVIGLGDQPFVTAAMVRRLLVVMEENPGLDFAASSMRGVVMPPAVIRHTMYKALRGLKGDMGARKLFASPDYTGEIVEFGEEAAELLLDVDDEDSLGQAVRRYRQIRGRR